MAAEMKTDAYMKCRGVGRIGRNPRADGPMRQARRVFSVWAGISSQPAAPVWGFVNLFHR